MRTDEPRQQPCSHCGDCVRACPEGLNPEALFLALAQDDFAAARRARLAACSECNRCVEVCPSHIPLLEWFQWGKGALRERDQADAARARFHAREARLARERAARRHGGGEANVPPVATISRAEVLAAIARGRAKRAGRTG